MARSGRTALTDGDFYLIERTLDPEGRQLLPRVRQFMEKPVRHQSSVNPIGPAHGHDNRRSAQVVT